MPEDQANHIELVHATDWPMLVPQCLLHRELPEHILEATRRIIIRQARLLIYLKYLDQSYSSERALKNFLVRPRIEHRS